jgi:thiosulfate dehydrogenase (quinone) large subunit
MFVKFLRENKTMAFMLTVVRLYLGWDWMNAGWHKIVDGFDASGFLKGALAKAGGDHPAVSPWWADFLEGFALPNVSLFNVLIPWGEFLVGLGLLIGVFTTFAALMGITMNFAFLFSGTVSSNPQMVLLTIFILVAGYNAAKIGGDRWVIPYIRREVKEIRARKNG